MKKVFMAAVALFTLSGCVALTATNISNVVPESKGERVTADASGFGILTLTLPDTHDLEVVAIKQLKAKGATKNITSRLQLRNWMIVQYYSVIATGEK